MLPVRFSFQYAYIGFAIVGSLSGQPGIAAIALLAGVMISLASIASVWVLARDGDWLRELVRNTLNYRYCCKFDPASACRAICAVCAPISRS